MALAVQRVRKRVARLTASGGSGARRSAPVGLAFHEHDWIRLLRTVGLFVCRDRACLCCAVCPGCLGSLEVAQRLREGITGPLLYWCPVHDPSREEAQ